jgi:hypothetical protein
LSKAPVFLGKSRKADRSVELQQLFVWSGKPITKSDPGGRQSDHACIDENGLAELAIPIIVAGHVTGTANTGF